MINHSRTLLLNALPAPGIAGEEYIPPEYKVRTVPPYLDQIRKILIGNNVNREVQNYRVRQLMTLLHSTSLSKYVYTMDPRVTYWPTIDMQCFKKEPVTLVPLPKLPTVLTEIADAELITLFSTRDNVATTFWEYWHEHKQLQYQIGGVTLALIYQMDELNELE